MPEERPDVFSIEGAVYGAPPEETLVMTIGGIGDLEKTIALCQHLEEAAQRWIEENCRTFGEWRLKDEPPSRAH